MQDHNSRYYPCAVIFPDGHCPGITIRKPTAPTCYECTRCGAIWNITGTPRKGPRHDQSSV